MLPGAHSHTKCFCRFCKNGGMDADVSEILGAIGPRLRSLREARALTLTAVAEQSGLSVSALSRVETGNRQPTLDVLIPLARVYRVSLDVLVGAPETGDPRVHLEPRHATHGGVIVPLTEYPGRVQVFKHVLGPRKPRLTSHKGHAWLYVLSGDCACCSETTNTFSFLEKPRSSTRWFRTGSAPTTSSPSRSSTFGPHGDRPVSRLDHP